MNFRARKLLNQSRFKPRLPSDLFYVVIDFLPNLRDIVEFSKVSNETKRATKYVKTMISFAPVNASTILSYPKLTTLKVPMVLIDTDTNLDRYGSGRYDYMDIRCIWKVLRLYDRIYPNFNRLPDIGNSINYSPIRSYSDIVLFAYECTPEDIKEIINKIPIFKVK